MKTSCARWCWLVLGLALFVRVGGVAVRGEWRLPNGVVGQEAGRMAEYLVAGRGFASPFDGGKSPSTHLPPVYPLLLAGLLKLQGWLGGDAGTPGAFVFYAALVVNLLASAVTPAVGMAIVRRAGWPQLVGVAAGVALCFCPEAVRAAGLIWDEALFTLAVAGLVWLMVDQLRRGPARVGAALVVGTAGGAVTMLNPAFFPALVAGWVLAVAAHEEQRPLWSRLRSLAQQGVIVVGVALAVGLPWHVRNWFMLDPPAKVFVRGNFPLEVWTSMNPLMWMRTADGREVGLPVHPWQGTDPLLKGGEPLTEQEYFAWCGQRARWRVGEDRRGFAMYVGDQVMSFWLGIGEAHRWRRNVWLFVGAQGVPAVVGLAGLILARRKLGVTAVGIGTMIAAVLAVFPLPYYLAGGAARYRHPVDVVIYLGIGWMVWWVAGRGKRESG